MFRVPDKDWREKVSELLRRGSLQGFGMHDDLAVSEIVSDYHGVIVLRLQRGLFGICPPRFGTHQVSLFAENVLKFDSSGDVEAASGII